MNQIIAFVNSVVSSFNNIVSGTSNISDVVLAIFAVIFVIALFFVLRIVVRFLVWLFKCGSKKDNNDIEGW